MLGDYVRESLVNLARGFDECQRQECGEVESGLII